MTAQPSDQPTGPIDRPRTPGAIRRALPADRHHDFRAALDGTEAEDLFAMVALWGAVAQTATDPEVDAATAAVRAGTERVHGLDAIFPVLADPR
ncbi:hypothetical protein ACIG5E_34260 [Kitasatospora sp. NPDC053057]|uniref:hypothetical protein n=1 Tax=Kitasatospora sp. NPDC053057 TaxID=3364062 RepID=UPI0037CAB0D7